MSNLAQYIPGNLGGAIQSVQLTLTSAELLNLKTTPIQLLPAPGAGKMILPQSVFAEYVFKGIDYSIPSNYLITITTAGANLNNFATLVIDPSVLLNQGVSTWQYNDMLAYAVDSSGAFPVQDVISSWENLPILISGDSTHNLTLGNGLLNIIVYYSIVNVS